MLPELLEADAGLVGMAAMAAARDLWLRRRRRLDTAQRQLERIARIGRYRDLPPDGITAEVCRRAFQASLASRPPLRALESIATQRAMEALRG